VVENERGSPEDGGRKTEEGGRGRAAKQSHKTCIRM
jgi:hypothetical protein